MADCVPPVRLLNRVDEAFQHCTFERITYPALRTCARLAQLQVEFMEHDERPLPIDIRLLGALARKALHYKEMEFEGALSNRRDANPVAVVVALIQINNQLHQYEAAVGILTSAQQHLGVQLKEPWYEKFQLWDGECIDGSSNGTFFKAFLLVRRGKVLESYERTYSNTVIEYCTIPPMGNPLVEGRRSLFPNLWDERIKGARRNIEVNFRTSLSE
ncbi:hypothetical protein KY290_036474 [Solanum tuberosum]|uniref:Uncharacterized protein n=1 Tax=Solanum tuberosum TaxID=4113 RepID=A0ABQ7TSR8_SOLTU|nr:hypothetical protein KY285_035774 [Solanum tuberosum]KAH0737769.1 hypothetical protein KY290_036474 [Solanum tuberosum]